MNDERIIKVDQEWFEKLESYLLPDERICNKEQQFPNLVLFTDGIPDPKMITFVFVPSVKLGSSTVKNSLQNQYKSVKVLSGKNNYELQTCEIVQSFSDGRFYSQV